MLLQNHDVPALMWNDQRVTYRDLLRRIDAVAAQLPEQLGDKVAIFSENRLEWVYAFYAGIKRGCTLVPIDFMSSAEDVAYILNDCAPSLVFCSESTRAVLAQALERCRERPPVVVLDALETAAAELDADPAPIPVPALDKTLLLIYTSGTTGSPKGVMLSWDNLLANIESISESVPIYTPGQRVLALLPLHHIFPLLGALITPLYTGGSCVFSPSMASEDMLRALNEGQVTIIIGVPRLYRLIAKSIMDKINASGLARLLFKLAAQVNSPAFSKRLFAKVHARFGGQIRFLVSGGAKLDEDVFRDLTILGFEVLEGFGMTEAAPMITFTRPGESRLGAAGRPMPCNEVRLLEGEIITRGRNVMQGYYKRPQETAAVVKDGWLYTGDLGYLDDAGALHVTGRKKEIIVLPSGKNVNPLEIEEKLAGASDLIGEVAVFQQQDSLQAVVVPDFRKARQQGIVDLQQTLNEQVLVPYNQTVTPYKKVMKLHLLGEELPRTRLGKLKRFLLSEMVTSTKTRAAGPAEPDDPEYQAIQRFLQQQKGCEVYASDHLELDLGLDSLDRVGLQSFLQATFGVGLSDEALIEHPTVGRLAQFIRDKKTKMAVSAVEWAEILKQRSTIQLPRSWAAHNALRHGMAALARGYFRLRGKGVEQLPAGPCILAANHQSFLDGLFVAAFLDNATMKRTYFFAKAKHVKSPWLRFLALRNNVIVLDLERDLQHALQNLAEVLRKGCNIIIFPEGTRSKAGTVAPFRKTYAILSRELGVPVMPVAIKGACQALPAGSWLPRLRAPIEVSFLPAVEPGEYSYEALNQAVMDRVVAAVQSPRV
jgi:long-chain acyl-CoA synthetase